MSPKYKLFLIGLAFASGVDAFAGSALYLTENKIINWIQEESADTYKIYGEFKAAPDKYKSRIVKKSEISLSSDKAIDGHKLGAWALALNRATQALEHCLVSELFENTTMVIFCDIIQNNQYIRHQFLGTTKNFITQIPSPVGGFEVGERVFIKKNTPTINLGAEVLIRAFFANGTVLVQKNGLQSHFTKGPMQNALSSIVDLTELTKTN